MTKTITNHNIQPLPQPQLLLLHNFGDTFTPALVDLISNPCTKNFPISTGFHFSGLNPYLTMTNKPLPEPFQDGITRRIIIILSLFRRGYSKHADCFHYHFYCSLVQSSHTGTKPCKQKLANNQSYNHV